MMLKCLAVSVILCLPLHAFGYYHGKKHSDHHVYDTDNKDIEKLGDKVDHHGRHRTHKDTDLKDYNFEKKHNSKLKHHNDHVKKEPLMKKRRSINEENTYARQFQVDGGEYAVTTDYPSFRRFNRDIFDDTKNVRKERESRVRRIEKIRADLMKRFGSYVWRHSFKSDIWYNLYKEVEHSMDRMRQFHEEQRAKLFQQFPENNNGKDGAQKIKVDYEDPDKEKNKRINEEEYFAPLTDQQLFATTKNPFFGPDGDDVFEPQKFPSFPDDKAESNGHDLTNEKPSISNKDGHGYSNKWRQHKHHHHHYSETKTTFIDHNFDFGSSDKRKNHNHNSQCRHHPSLGHYGRHPNPSSGTNGNLYSHHVTHSTTSKYQQTHPKGTSTHNAHGNKSPTIHSMDQSIVHSHTKNDSSFNINEHLKNVTGINSNKELFTPVNPDFSLSTELPHGNGSTSYSVYETPEVREFHKSISDLNITTLNKPSSNMNATHHPIHINYDIKKVQPEKKINTTDSSIHFPVDDPNSDNKEVSTDPCKNGGLINIPLLNVNLPCGNVGFYGGRPDDYYKREFATSLTNVFHDYLEKEKEQKEKSEALDIDIRIGRKRRAAKNLINKKGNKTFENSTESGKGNASVFGEIMDVPKDLSKNDSNEFFDLTMLSDYFLEAVESLDEASLIDVLVALKDDYLSKSPSDQTVVDEVYDKLVSSLLEYKRSNGDWNERRRRESPPKTRPEAAAALELLAENDQYYESEQQDDPSVNEDDNDRAHELDSNEDPSFLELVSLADKHKLKSR